MTLAKNGIRFIDSGYNEKFRMPDGGKVRIEFADGTSEEMVCRYIDDTHVEFNGGEGPYNLQHICQFAEQLEKIGAKVVPVTEPMTLFKQRYYCPLQLVVFEQDEYGDAQDDGYVFDGKYAAHFEEDIKGLLGREHSYEGCDPKSMASYQDNAKVLSTEWDAENVRGTLYGVIRVGLAAKLSASEEEKPFFHTGGPKPSKKRRQKRSRIRGFRTGFISWSNRPGGGRQNRLPAARSGVSAVIGRCVVIV